MLIAWILINGSLSALGVLIAKGHPLTILTAFIAAPLTSLNPMIAAGWIAAATETKIRHPKIKDFEDLDKIQSLTKLTNNNVTRILLVAALANLGSTIGTLIAFPTLLAMLM